MAQYNLKHINAVTETGFASETDPNSSFKSSKTPYASFTPRGGMLSELFLGFTHALPLGEYIANHFDKEIRLTLPELKDAFHKGDKKFDPSELSTAIAEMEGRRSPDRFGMTLTKFTKA